MIIVNTDIKGRCVFSDTAYRKGETIEVCEYIVIPQNQIETLKKTVINDYWFGSDGDRGDALLLLGHGSLYNHSTKDPNMTVVMDSKDKRIGFVAYRDIKNGEELVFDYGYTPRFQVRGNLSIERRIGVK